MRPLSLTVEGFTCFAERQPTLDFRNLHLFAIAGPTGAGKSSILDAMMFALYGYVPRLGKAGADLITTGRDRLAVEFEFAVGERTFRIARTLRRRQGAKVVLEETTGGRARPLGDKVTETNAAIEQLIGIGYDGFSQSVVLPQGRFDTFLRGAGGNRRDLLKGLLGLERYERMRKLAVERRAEVDRQIAASEQVLATLAHATAQQLERARAELAAAECEKARATEQVRDAESRVADLRQRRQLTVELAAKQDELAALNAQASGLARAEARLEASRRAAPALPAIEAAEAAAERLARSAGELEAAQAAERRSDTDRQAAAAAHAAAAGAAAATAALRERIDALNRLHGVVVRLREIAAKQPALDTAVQQLSREAAKAQRARHEAEAAARRALDACEAAQRAVDAIGYDAWLHERLRPLLNDTQRAAELDARAGMLRQARAERAADAAESEKRSARAAAAATRARRTVEQAQAAAESMRQALEQARSAQMAAVLRRNLCAGDACPVCDHIVDVVPGAGAVPEVDAISVQLMAAEGALEKARAAQNARDSEAIAARTQLSERLKAVERLDAELGAVETQRAEADERIEAAVAGIAAAGPGGRSVRSSGDGGGAAWRQWVTDECSRLDALRQQFDAAQAALVRARERVHAAESARLAACHALERADQAREQAAAAVATCQREREKLAADVAAVTSADDPDAERRALEARAAELERALAAAERAWRDAEAAHKSAAAVLDSARARVEQDRLEADALRQAAEGAIRAAGFDSAAAVRQAIVAEAEQATLRRRIEEHEKQHRAVTARLRDIEEQLAGAAVTADDLSGAEAECDRLRQAHTQAVTRAATLRAEVKQLETDVAKADAARTSLERDRRAFAVADVLARELGGDRFQQYLLEETLEHLVRGASVRLRELSGRYTLEWREDRFHVIDHDNARERRIADTLSGGETFLASLALALELSEQVQRSAGRVRIDSLFIDEGFGTLDADTLGVVAEAIETLQMGGRMVGIITHIEDLTARLPGCIRVLRRPAQGSSWRIERSA